MTIPQAKKEVRTKLDASKIEFEKLSGKTESFEGLGYGESIFITIHGAIFAEDFNIKSLTDGVPKPSEGGYCVQTKGCFRGDKPILFN